MTSRYEAKGFQSLARFAALGSALFWSVTGFAFLSCDSSTSDKNTNWLGGCSRSVECKPGLACRYGMCTRLCGTAAECADLSPTAVCKAPSIGDACAPDTGKMEQICTLACSGDGACVRADGLVCASGACARRSCTTDAAVPPGDGPHATLDAGKSDRDASPGTGGKAEGGARARDASAVPTGTHDAGTDASTNSAPTRYDDVEIVVPAQLRSLHHDPKRHAVYGLFNNSLQNKIVRFRFDGSGWKYDTFDVPGAVALTLRPDFSELLVTTVNCVLVHMNPDTMERGTISDLPAQACFSGAPGVYALAGGQVLYTSNITGSQLWEYPSHTKVDAPSIRQMVVYRSVDGTRLIWADPSAITQGGRSLSIYDAEVRGFTTLSTITGEYSTVMAISSRGRRFLHTADVYDASFRYLGALDSGPDPWFIGVSGNGEAAAAYRLQTGSLHVHDVRPVVGPFSAVGAPVPCAPPESGFVESIVMDDEGTVAFLSVLHGVSLTDYTYHFVVRNLPALPR